MTFGNASSEKQEVSVRITPEDGAGRVLSIISSEIDRRKYEEKEVLRTIRNACERFQNGTKEEWYRAVEYLITKRYRKVLKDMGISMSFEEKSTEQ